MIAEVRGTKRLETVNEICIDLVVRDDDQIRMSILFYVPIGASKNYSIGDKFDVTLTRRVDG